MNKRPWYNSEEERPWYERAIASVGIFLLWHIPVTLMHWMDKVLTWLEARMGWRWWLWTFIFAIIVGALAGSLIYQLMNSTAGLYVE